MRKLTEGVVLRAAVFMGYSASDARLAWKLGYESDHRYLVEDAIALGFDLEFAYECDDAVRSGTEFNKMNRQLQENLFLQKLNEGKLDERKD